MKKIIIIGVVVGTFLIGGAVGASSNLFEEEIDVALQSHKNELAMKISHSESNAIAYYVSQLEIFKNEEIERAKSEMNSIADKKIEKINNESNDALENDKQKIRDYVNKKIEEIAIELQ